MVDDEEPKLDVSCDEVQDVLANSPSSAVMKNKVNKSLTNMEDNAASDNAAGDVFELVA